jgi:hypothetical protein
MGIGQPLQPEFLGLQMMREDFRPLGGIIELDAFLSR